MTAVAFSDPLLIVSIVISEAVLSGSELFRKAHCSNLCFDGSTIRSDKVQKRSSVLAIFTYGIFRTISPENLKLIYLTASHFAVTVT